MTKYQILKNELLEQQKTWLITGVAGFIGSNLLETLLQFNQKVIGLDNFSTGFKKNIDDVLHNVGPLKKNFILLEGDIRNPDDCKKSVKNVDFVLHQAALGSIPRSIKMPEVTNDTNVNGFLNMLIASKDANVTKFVYASSSSVYGDSQKLPKIESEVGNPLSPYAASKYTNELYAKAFSNSYGIQTIGLRYFNVFGPRQCPDGPYAAVIPLWIKSILEDQDVYIYGDGETSRDFCYIDNAVQTNLLAATTTNELAYNKVYNVTVGERTTLNELYQLISSLLGSSKKPIYKEFRNGDIRHSHADINLCQNLLGYFPTFSVQKGLAETINWFSTRIKIDVK